MPMDDPTVIKLFKVPAGATVENRGNGCFRVTDPNGRVEEIVVFLGGYRLATEPLAGDA